MIFVQAPTEQAESEWILYDGVLTVVRSLVRTDVSTQAKNSCETNEEQIERHRQAQNLLDAAASAIVRPHLMSI